MSNETENNSTKILNMIYNIKKYTPEQVAEVLNAQTNTTSLIPHIASSFHGHPMKEDGRNDDPIIRKALRNLIEIFLEEKDSPYETKEKRYDRCADIIKVYPRMLHDMIGEDGNPLSTNRDFLLSRRFTKEGDMLSFAGFSPELLEDKNFKYDL